MTEEHLTLIQDYCHFQVWTTDHTKRIGLLNQGQKRKRKPRYKEKKNSMVLMKRCASDLLVNGEVLFNPIDTFRPLPRHLVDGQTARLGEMSSATKLVYMSLS
jgi:hypothetical protein